MQDLVINNEVKYRAAGCLSRYLLDEKQYFYLILILKLFLQINVVCETIAFGMGIDKTNVRFVIHAALPKSIEGYYQESGRAGRDSECAECILFYNYGDMYRHRKMIEMDVASNKEAQKTHMNNLFKMVAYCENTTDCRRAVQLNYFGEIFDRRICISNKSTVCDNCRNQVNYFRKIDKSFV